MNSSPFYTVWVDGEYNPRIISSDWRTVSSSARFIRDSEHKSTEIKEGYSQRINYSLHPTRYFA